MRHPMTAPKWKNFMIGLIDGLERHLCASAPKSASLGLKSFRARVTSARTAGARGMVERDLDRFVESKPWLRAAASRYVVEQLDGVTKKLESIAKDLERRRKSGSL